MSPDPDRIRPPFTLPPVDWAKYREMLAEQPDPDPDAATRYAQARYRELVPDEPTAKALDAALDRRIALDEAARLVDSLAAHLRDEIADAFRAGRDTGNLHAAIEDLTQLKTRIRRARPWAKLRRAQPGPKGE